MNTHDILTYLGIAATMVTVAGLGAGSFFSLMTAYTRNVNVAGGHPDVTFESFRYCVTIHSENTTINPPGYCTETILGYDITTLKYFDQVFSLAPSIDAGSMSSVLTLTHIMILHPVSAFIAFMGLLGFCLGRFRVMGFGAVSLVMALSTITTTIVATDYAWLNLVRTFYLASTAGRPNKGAYASYDAGMILITLAYGAEILATGLAVCLWWSYRKERRRRLALEKAHFHEKLVIMGNNASEYCPESPAAGPSTRPQNVKGASGGKTSLVQ